MIEFKGSKGRWRVEQSLFYKTDKVILADHRAICRITIEDEESKKNALLISKAPEMLFLLKDLLSDKGLNDVSRREVELLIKQATEL